MRINRLYRMRNMVYLIFGSNRNFKVSTSINFQIIVVAERNDDLTTILGILALEENFDEYEEKELFEREIHVL
ncbi:hypothetical protein C1645_878355 [Glomus cerebriforme]|uniref:Uncharacterized protein n=1 Tax=Glomus cerebriforme TaxID=658196 RepID=A0A397SL63_9GLOM|nr:hypothetical protein C1645_878355 [Glomus cerebriforme]